MYQVDPDTYELKFNNSKKLKIEVLCKSAIAVSMYAAVVVQLVAFVGVVPSVQLYEGIFVVGFTF